MPPPSDLTLLGTVHNDPQGYKRLREFLRCTKPDCIFVELSPYALKFRRRHQHALQRTFSQNLKQAAGAVGLPWREAIRHPAITAIRRQISLPAEYRAAARHGAETGSRLFPVDDSLFSRRWLASWPQLLSAKNLTALLTHPPTPPAVPRLYEQAASSMAGLHTNVFESRRFFAMGQDPMWNERERHLAYAITRLCRLFHPRKPVYLGGWWHLTSGGAIPTLRDLLNIPTERCLLLDRWRNP